MKEIIPYLTWNTTAITTQSFRANYKVMAFKNNKPKVERLMLQMNDK